MKKPLTIAAALLTLCGGAIAYADATSTDGWKPCGDDDLGQCREISVPLDWNSPHGAHITLAVTRHLPADGRSPGRTILITNGSGVSTATAPLRAQSRQTYFSDDEIAHSQIVGVELRGGGNTLFGDPAPVRSTQLDCAVNAHDDTVALQPHSRKEYRDLAAHNRDFVDGCRRGSGDLVEHMDAKTQARDMEAVRQAVGADTLSWLAFTNASLIAEEYAARYPARLDTVVMDGPADHALSLAERSRREASDVESSFGRFARWCADTTSCALHGNARQITDQVTGVFADADDHPVKLPDGHTVDGDQLAFLDQQWLEIGDMPPAESGWTALAASIAEIRQHQPAKTFASMYDSAYGLHPFWDVNRATNCANWDPDIDGFGDLARRQKAMRALGPELRGASEASETLGGCAGWPVKPNDPPHVSPIHGDATFLVIAGRHDAFAPYTESTRVARRTHASLLTYEGDAHIAFFSSRCVRDAIHEQFDSGRVTEHTCGP
ncbi:MAG TPA: alpha/beta fold hydrolase [Stackebrandtia sp.]|jgi:pimeloyl-ACP methyl ester carboxylesterase|uniref:alpha/beta fold hydrolase n=1 Tax=Stackebrandtia sp. TaxID=2023065 RepID=UPI002D49D00C|nr:alpha/beta fold hydrolase [Stackebrandtia sp.]HZE37562.1 alpha/beta fold hydrolase [Stackebrandtia sp.]